MSFAILTVSCLSKLLALFGEISTGGSFTVILLRVSKKSVYVNCMCMYV